MTDGPRPPAATARAYWASGSRAMRRRPVALLAPLAPALVALIALALVTAPGGARAADAPGDDAAPAAAPADEASADKAPADGASVVAAARARQAGFADKTSRVEMRVVAPSGEERVRTLRGYEKRSADGRRLLWIFESPADVAGTGFLARQQSPRPDEMWVYFPGQRRVRRISPDLAREHFQGSTFTYEDLSMAFYLDYDAGSHALVGEEACGAKRCFVVESALPAGRFSYDALRTWIRTDDPLPQQIEFRGARGSKRLRVLRAETIAGVPTIVEAEMSTPDGYRTIIRYDDVEYDRGLDEDAFTVAALERMGK
jgi:hypothetical protein